MSRRCASCDWVRPRATAFLRTAVAKLDHAVLETYGGLNGALHNRAALETEAAASRPQKPTTSAGRAWPSVRLPTAGGVGGAGCLDR